ncbi:endo-1,4-beta-xylanase [Parastagonospora nodorum]|uniref:Endo-1,4-beta-xylanase n=1 Tax=Phaeosphaeria nodorum (strain SN15 / ATCC MYA-4574 / FGSC 10173) TaxID=321614 RepID=A0A7U2F2S3_PHANO|nr:endo-1,4-beta-xylanase [Parastagonospora nodorum]QRC97622.1 endo-1,4-beta-xylanase [Parastagonospora nodorum SN15]KAH3924656.1 endo-1,4-beta-xylanase [Parastagonospora nodorum]KAH3941965.1 endo-1,4-beta-xylanase [Parastagonospora nodorum]KAH3957442.1 endo-1,4-beta-xylanase [Parastagonospora nodorum]
MLSLATAILAILSAVVAAPQPHIEERQNSFNAIQNWANDFADVTFKNNAGGNFNVTWDNNPGGNFVVGKGYRPGRDMLFNYTGTFKVNGWAYLALYGWTTNPLVEYYVIESMGKHNPSDNASANYFGTLDSDGATYEIWQKERTNAPSIIGDNTDFQQYWSIRTKMHCGGTINTGNHFRAWEAAGLKLGKQNYMVMGIEGQQGSGEADITVGQRPTVAVPETTTSTYRSVRRTSTRPTSTRAAATTTRVTTTTRAA